MIGLPYNDHQCLGAITQILATMVEENDPVLLELAAQYPTTRELVDYIRSLPQREQVVVFPALFAGQFRRVQLHVLDTALLRES